ncbi:hypothetical protein OG590_40565 (plasmid) [Streptomyces goshikiensis]|uniref:hypothetical protein n=1 Tax=Streptomyces goshikiensis TaxID=1942 RepID=UPI00386811D2|nr:hypothetical protein OG590_40565 [Streptomyces goshikiensis]
MNLTPAAVLGRRKVPDVPGQMDLFGTEAPEPTATEDTDSTEHENDRERTAQ